jgi:predicted helicase
LNDGDPGAWKPDRSAIVNPRVTLTGIPDEAHRYMLGSRSALEWIIDRYQVKTDKASGIVNDPNDWCDQHDNPRYIIDLIKRIVTVSVQTMKIVDNLRPCFPRRDDARGPPSDRFRIPGLHAAHS